MGWGAIGWSACSGATSANGRLIHSVRKPDMVRIRKNRSVVYGFSREGIHASGGPVELIRRAKQTPSSIISRGKRILASSTLCEALFIHCQIHTAQPSTPPREQPRRSCSSVQDDGTFVALYTGPLPHPNLDAPRPYNIHRGSAPFSILSHHRSAGPNSFSQILLLFACLLTNTSFSPTSCLSLFFSDPAFAVRSSLYLCSTFLRQGPGHLVQPGGPDHVRQRGFLAELSSSRLNSLHRRKAERKWSEESPSPRRNLAIRKASVSWARGPSWRSSRLSFWKAVACSSTFL